MYPDNTVKKVNICESHLKDIAIFMNVETPTGKFIKLNKRVSKDNQLSLRTWSE
jgi:hypothetical protein